MVNLHKRIVKFMNGVRSSLTLYFYSQFRVVFQFAGRTHDNFDRGHDSYKLFLPSLDFLDLNLTFDFSGRAKRPKRGVISNVEIMMCKFVFISDKLPWPSLSKQPDLQH
jgi:hypothetical protein